jgi:predicted cobalt transporter CbtA
MTAAICSASPATDAGLIHVNGTNMLTARTFLVRGLLAGLIAGVLTFGVAYLVGEPPVASAISFEESPSAAPETADHAMPADAATAEHSHSEDAPLVSRANQATWGLATATVVFGVALGGIIGLVSAFAVGRLGRLTARASTMLVAAIGFVAVYFVPYLKYPPNPPAVGDPNTIGHRTELYFAMLACSVVAAVAAVVLARRLARKMDAWNAVLIAIAGYVVVTGLVAWLLPVVDEVPADFSADLLWRFRMASLTVQATLWLVTGLLLATMIATAARKVTAARPGGGQILTGTSA